MLMLVLGVKFHKADRSKNELFHDFFYMDEFTQSTIIKLRSSCTSATTRDGKFPAGHVYGQRDEGWTPLPDIWPMMARKTISRAEQKRDKNSSCSCMYLIFLSKNDLWMLLQVISLQQVLQVIHAWHK